MCGISGVVGPGATAAIAKRMSDAIRHRGPDGDGAWSAVNVALSHRRLSIIDIEGGAQPMISATGRWVLIFNGEIYNHRELRGGVYADYPYQTSCDTEVILAGLELEGDAVLNRLAGMFAIAAWDARLERLLLARDGQGIKPLYFAEKAGDGLLFGSEIGALEAGGIELSADAASLGAFLDLRFVPPPRTIFQGVCKLLPGHMAYVSADGEIGRPEPFAFHAPAVNRALSRDEAMAEVTNALHAAVERQMIADVPVGILLSGGVDSAVVTAAAARTSEHVSTFCVGYADAHDANEFAEARETAELLGTDHHELSISAADAVAAMPKLVRHLEEPVVTTSIFSFYLLCEEVARHRKVVLTGQGADEPWAGYGRHRFARMLPALRLLRPLLRPALLKTVMSADEAERVAAVLSAKDEVGRWKAFNATFTSIERTRITASDTSATEDLLASYLPFLPRNGTEFERMLAFEVRSSLPDNLLMLADKLSMAHSLEVRVPLLDPLYLSTVEQLPQHLRRRLWSKGGGKYLHKKVCEALLPPQIVHRPKKGFQTPVEVWMRGELGQYLHRLVSDADSFARRHLSVEAVRDLISAHGHGRSGNLERQLFAIWVLEEWYRAFPHDDVEVALEAADVTSPRRMAR